MRVRVSKSSQSGVWVGQNRLDDGLKLDKGIVKAKAGIEACAANCDTRLYRLYSLTGLTGTLGRRGYREWGGKTLPDSGRGVGL